MVNLPRAALWRRLVALAFGLAVIRILTPQICGIGSDSWLHGQRDVRESLANHLVAFEARDDRSRHEATANRFAGEWALVTHQMTALGLAQVVLAHPELKERYLPTLAVAAGKTFFREMRGFGTRAWHGQDAMASLSSNNGHAYMAYPALAVGMARLVGATLPKRVIRDHDRLIAAFVRRLGRSRTGLIETYPKEAYPTDVAAVAGAIALHGRVTGRDYSRVLDRWAAAVRRVQVHQPSGFVYQRMDAKNGKPRDAPRGSGTALAGYFAGFADRSLREFFTKSVTAHESTCFGFSGIREHAEGFSGGGDVDSGPVVLGVSVAATGFALALARSPAHQKVFTRLMRTVGLFGIPTSQKDQRFFASGGPIGNALLLAMLTSGPEVAP
ncbi:MAG: hypothetical protein JRH20_30705 [Deltaproteobacteria bacterium]|nr:hypothetical protein [Deltaproteobacteria bacterium]